MKYVMRVSATKVRADDRKDSLDAYKKVQDELKRRGVRFEVIPTDKGLAITVKGMKESELESLYDDVTGKLTGDQKIWVDRFDDGFNLRDPSYYNYY